MATSFDYTSTIDIRLPLVPATTSARGWEIFQDIDTIFNSLRLLAGAMQTVPGTSLLADLPPASQSLDRLMLVTDATGGTKLVISNGTDWVLVNTSTVVS